MDRCTSHAAEAVLAAGSNGEAPAKPAPSEAQAQVEGMNWNNPEAPETGL